MKASEITLERIREAYRKTGLEPTSGHAFVVGGKCCAMGALLVDAGIGWDAGPGSVRRISEAEAALGIECESFGGQVEGKSECLAAFVHGFDDGFGNFPRARVGPAYVRGHEVGLALRTEGVK